MGSRSVIVTGVADGIGRATAYLFAKSKDRLLLTDPNPEKGRAVMEDITQAGGTASFIEADLHEKLDVHNVVAEALDAYGGVHVLAHCSSFFFAKPLLETTQDDYDTVFDKNVRAAFLINRAAAKAIIKQAEDIDDGGVDVARSGAIVNVVSSEAITATADHALFAATQGAVTQLTKAVALTLSEVGARANTVAVAGIKSELDDVELTTRKAREALISATPLSRRGDPEEAANAVHFLASPNASFITGQSLFVDGGRLVQHWQGRPEDGEG